MNIYLDAILFSLIILIYWIMTELFTVLFRFTGLPDEKARFQVISLLTGTGFTTRESEMFLSTKPRRRLARITMLFGYVFNITIVTTIINVFLSLKLHQVEHYYVSMLIPLCVIALVFIFIRQPGIKARCDNLLRSFADRLIGHADSTNTVLLVDYVGGDSIALVTLNTVPERFRELPLSKTGLRSDTGILVLLVEHAGKKAVPAGADTVFAPGDRLTVFGSYTAICKTFQAHERFTDK